MVASWILRLRDTLPFIHFYVTNKSHEFYLHVFKAQLLFPSVSYITTYIFSPRETERKQKERIHRSFEHTIVCVFSLAMLLNVIKIYQFVRNHCKWFFLTSVKLKWNILWNFLKSIQMMVSALKKSHAYRFICRRNIVRLKWEKRIKMKWKRSRTYRCVLNLMFKVFNKITAHRSTSIVDTWWSLRLSLSLYLSLSMYIIKFLFAYTYPMMT